MPASAQPAAGSETGAPPITHLAWSDFALPPLRLKAPLGWHPLVSEWTVQSAKVRWETLTVTPLELNWRWHASDAQQEDRNARLQRIEKAFTRECKAVEDQAKVVGAAFAWDGVTQLADSFLKQPVDGRVRGYTWNGRRGWVALVNLTAKKRQALLAAAICPPDFDPEPERTAVTLLNSAGLQGEGEPLVIALAGLALAWPSEYRIVGLRGREGHAYLQFQAPGKRLDLVRLEFSDLHLYNSSRNAVFKRLAREIIERGNPPEPQDTSIRGHAGARLVERRWFYVRLGDWIIRLLSKRWQGETTVLAWTCEESRRIWALGARCGAAGALAELEQRIAEIDCHGRIEHARIDWRRYVEAEAQAPQRPKPPAKKDDANDAAKDPRKPAGPPEDWRRLQLAYRVRTRKEVRLEKSSKDKSGDLVYEAAPAGGMIAKVLRVPQEPQLKRLSLDPVGCRIWELLTEGPCLGEVLAALSTDFQIHPVAMFPKLLAFMKMLGERRLIDLKPPKGVEHFVEHLNPVNPANPGKPEGK
ncbi:MAG: PqqD family protein [Planctomycetes bacterium]|nr:PqqD family protein [Planctomycetota bacterium]